MSDTPPSATEDAERLAEIRRMVNGSSPLGDVYAKLRYVFAQLDARDARIAEFESGRAYRDSLEERDRLTAALDKYAVHIDGCYGSYRNATTCKCGLNTVLRPAAPASPERTHE